MALASLTASPALAPRWRAGLDRAIANAMRETALCPAGTVGGDAGSTGTRSKVTVTGSFHR